MADEKIIENSKILDEDLDKVDGGAAPATKITSICSVILSTPIELDIQKAVASVKNEGINQPSSI